VPPATCGHGFSGVIGRVVIVELALTFLRHEPKDAEMPVGHDRPPPGSGIGIETATASGSERGTSTSLNRRKPIARSRPATGCGTFPHCGQAARYAAAAGVKRSRQSGQQMWVIADPVSLDASRPIHHRLSSPAVLSGQSAPARPADTIHHRIIQPRVTWLEVHPVAPTAEHPQDVPAPAAILSSPTGTP